MDDTPRPTAAPTNRKITDQRTLQRWKKSASYLRIVAYVKSLSDAVVGKKTTYKCDVCPALQLILQELDQMRKWVDEIPPVQQAMRYGNKAFKTWHERMTARTPELMEQLLAAQPSQSKEVVEELGFYFSDSFGNATRIDYGTGHELSFAVWLSCLEQLGVLGEADRCATVIVIFQRYLKLMRDMQTTYWLEPAGSHGVWGLDDYQFLPFLLGAAQLVGQSTITPSMILDDKALDMASDWLYLEAVEFVKLVKKGPFGEHSPYLHDISGLDNWQRVTTGLLRMYEGEVLGKLPVVQHLKFGSLLPWATPCAE